MKSIYNYFRYTWLAVAATITLASCSDDDEGGVTPDPLADLTAGNADFSTYVSLGNSLTAGYTDGGLFIAGQLNAFPNLLASQFSLVGGGEFNQPLANDNVGGLLLGGNQIAENRLFFDGSGPARLPGTSTTEVSQILSGPFNNMGVPGAKSFHLLAPGYGNIAGVATGASNPYFVRFASSPGTTVLADAVAQNPSFFTLWIGANDVLGYAIEGGDGTVQTNNVDVSTYGSSDVTDPNAFAGIYSSLVTALTAGGAQGVVANVPDVTAIPYFTTVPYNPVPLDAATAAAVNQGYATYNGGLQQVAGLGAISADELADRTISFQAGQNPVVIVDEYLTDLSAFGLPSIRQVTPEDLLVLPGASFIGTTVGGNPQLINGVTVPLEDRWALTVSEIEEIKTATDAFNDIISAVAQQNNLALVDVNSLINQIDQGLPFDEFTLTSELVFGGAFGLDGIHLTPRGNAFIANQFIEAIEAAYEARLPRFRAADFGTGYPASL